jgi:hypothetical protein
MQRLIAVLMIVLVALSACGGTAPEAPTPEPPTPTPDPLAGLYGKDWTTSVASVEVVGFGANLDMTMVFYRNGDVRASVPPIARYTGKFGLADEGLLRFDWEEEIIGTEERREITEFWQFQLRGSELVLTNDETGEERVFKGQ